MLFNSHFKKFFSDTQTCKYCKLCNLSDRYVYIVLIWKKLGFFCTLQQKGSTEITLAYCQNFILIVIYTYLYHFSQNFHSYSVQGHLTTHYAKVLLLYVYNSFRCRGPRRLQTKV